MVRLYFRVVPKYVKMGIININDNDTKHKQELIIAETIVHPEYIPPKKYNDIALVKLERPINFNSYVRPACLYTEQSISAEKAIAIGWGHTSYAGSASDILLKVTLDFVSPESCNMSYKSSFSRHFYGLRDESQVCAGKDGKDTCNVRETKYFVIFFNFWILG